MKRNIKLVVFMELVILVCVIMAFEYVGMPDHGMYGLGRLIDIPSFLLLLFIVIPSLIFMGEWKNFIKAFSVGQKKYTLLELKNINGAVASCQKLILWGGIVGCVLQITAILLKLSDVAHLGPNVMVALLIVFYTAVFEYLLIPVKLNAESVMNEEIDMDIETEKDEEVSSDIKTEAAEKTASDMKTTIDEKISSDVATETDRD